jgi:dynein heavy chain
MPQRIKTTSSIRSEQRSRALVFKTPVGTAGIITSIVSKSNLQMALCFSPVGDEGLRRRARQFPALVNSTVIDWFQPWPKQALRNVAASFLKEIDFIPEAIRENVIDFMPYSFERVNKASEEMLPKERRYVYTTRKSFFELIKLFKTMLNRKKDKLESSKGRYQLGLEKLQETAASVSQLEKEL